MGAGEFVLAHTVEEITLGACLAGQVYGKSSIGRLGLEVENAGYIDPGFSGQITLELKNTTNYTIRLTVGMPIAQMAVHRLSSPAVRPYGHPSRSSRYMGQMGATPSRYALGREVKHG
jgi:dCTP deaminase